MASHRTTNTTSCYQLVSVTTKDKSVYFHFKYSVCVWFVVSQWPNLSQWCCCCFLDAQKTTTWIVAPLSAAERGPMESLQGLEGEKQLPHEQDPGSALSPPPPAAPHVCTKHHDHHLINRPGGVWTTHICSCTLGLTSLMNRARYNGVFISFFDSSFN